MMPEAVSLVSRVMQVYSTLVYLGPCTEMVWYWALRESGDGKAKQERDTAINKWQDVRKGVPVACTVHI